MFFQLDMTAYEHIFMPICRNNHWMLLVVKPQQGRIAVLDSLSMPATKSARKNVILTEWRFVTIQMYIFKTLIENNTSLYKK